MIVSVSAHCRKCWMWIHALDIETLKRYNCSCGMNKWNVWEVYVEETKITKKGKYYKL